MSKMEFRRLGESRFEGKTKEEPWAPLRDDLCHWLERGYQLGRADERAAKPVTVTDLYAFEAGIAHAKAEDAALRQAAQEAAKALIAASRRTMNSHEIRGTDLAKAEALEQALQQPTATVRVYESSNQEFNGKGYTSPVTVQHNVQPTVAPQTAFKPHFDQHGADLSTVEDAMINCAWDSEVIDPIMERLRNHDHDVEQRVTEQIAAWLNNEWPHNSSVPDMVFEIRRGDWRTTSAGG